LYVTTSKGTMKMQPSKQGRRVRVRVRKKAVLLIGFQTKDPPIVEEYDSDEDELSQDEEGVCDNE